LTGEVVDGILSGVVSRPALPAQIVVLGSVSVIDEVSVIALPPAEQQLIAILVAAGANGLAYDGLADELWGESPPKSSQASPSPLSR
jgi:hypothetical protein